MKVYGYGKCSQNTQIDATNVNHMFWPLKSLDPNLTEHLWTNVLALTTTTIKTQKEGIPLEEWSSVPAAEFHRCIKSAPLVACDCYSSKSNHQLAF